MVIALVMGVCMLAMPVIGVSAGSDYRVSIGQGCWLPDGNLTPTRLVNAQPLVYRTSSGQLRASCVGALPAGARLPTTGMTYSHSTTGRLCTARQGDQYFSSMSFSGSISPTGVVKINCLLR